MWKVPLSERLLPLLITLGLMAALLLAGCLREKTTPLGLLRNRLGWCLLAFVGAVAVHLFATQLVYARLGWLRALYLGGCILFLLWMLVHHFARKPGFHSRAVTALTTSFAAVSALLLLLEIIFIFPARTHGYAVNFANLNWHYRYGGPYDEEGFRARQHDPAEVKEKKVLLFLGDSFLAGSGVKQIEDRFADRIEEKMKNRWVVINRGVGGDDTRNHLMRLRQFKGKPDAIVLCWVPNDILVAAEELDDRFPLGENYTTLNPVNRFFVEHSYLWNYLYWSRPRNDMPAFDGYMQSVYENEKILQAHFDDLHALKQCADSVGAPMFVVLFPHMNQPSEYATKPIYYWCLARGIPALDLTPVFAKLPVEEMVVNVNDAHPNEKAHALAAEKILSFLKLQSF